jgi:hypothetical protein
MRHGQGKFFYQDGGMYEGNSQLIQAIGNTTKWTDSANCITSQARLHTKATGTRISSKVLVID